MRRSLVLTDETARHPFLASLPPHVRRGTEPVQPRQLFGLSRRDMREFVTNYCSCLLAVTVFIA